MVIRRQKIDRRANLKSHFGRIVDLPPSWTFAIECPHHGRIVLDLSSFRGQGRDELAEHIRDALWTMRHENVGITLKNHLFGGVKHFWQFLNELQASGQTITHLKQIDRRILDQFITWLELRIVTIPKNRGLRWTANAKRHIFSSLKSLLINRQKHVPEAVSPQLSFPRNPFPNSNLLSEKREAYSSTEQKRILSALNCDLRTIHEGDGPPLKPCQVLTVYLLLLSFSTGRNLQSLLDLRRDSLREHPLVDRELLVTTKRRGWATHSTSLRQSTGLTNAQRDVQAIPASIGDHIRYLCGYTEPIRADAMPEERDYVFLMRVTMHKRKGQVVRLDPNTTARYVQAFVERHGLLDDRGLPLPLSVARLRPTFANELYRRTRDVRRVQQALGHLNLETTARHYLSARIEAERDHSIVLDSMVSHYSRMEVDGKVLLAADGKLPLSDVKDLLSGGYNTAVARCKNPFRENDSVCKKFFACFTCPNMCVFEDDLWRIFSFYYRLLSERAKVGSTQWLKTYGPIIQRIDRDIASQFPDEKVEMARIKAKTNPHPTWKDPLQ